MASHRRAQAGIYAPAYSHHKVPEVNIWCETPVHPHHCSSALTHPWILKFHSQLWHRCCKCWCTVSQLCRASSHCLQLRLLLVRNTRGIYDRAEFWLGDPNNHSQRLQVSRWCSPTLRAPPVCYLSWHPNCPTATVCCCCCFSVRTEKGKLDLVGSFCGFVFNKESLPAVAPVQTAAKTGSIRRPFCFSHLLNFSELAHYWSFWNLHRPH